MGNQQTSTHYIFFYFVTSHDIKRQRNSKYLSVCQLSTLFLDPMKHLRKNQYILLWVCYNNVHARQCHSVTFTNLKIHSMNNIIVVFSFHFIFFGQWTVAICCAMLSLNHKIILLDDKQCIDDVSGPNKSNNNKHLEGD